MSETFPQRMRKMFKTIDGNYNRTIDNLFFAYLLLN